jgi:3-oxoacyl-[acyl-carrier protein] reductase
MDLGLKGRRALVMGGSRGLGKAVAQVLAEEGARVAICARDAARVAATAAEIGAEGLVCDLSVPGAADALVRQAQSQLGHLDVLVVNTGGPPSGQFTDLSDLAWHTAFEQLWMSAVGAIRAALPDMRARRFGRVIVITSITAREPVANLMLSNSLRAGLHGLINTLSKQVAADEVTVNALMPGYTRTERLEELHLDEAKLAAQIPARRLGHSRDFAALAAFLASDQAGYVTGQAIACDGGLLQSI